MRGLQCKKLRAVQVLYKKTGNFRQEDCNCKSYDGEIEDWSILKSQRRCGLQGSVYIGSDMLLDQPSTYPSLSLIIIATQVAGVTYRIGNRVCARLHVALVSEIRACYGLKVRMNCF